MAASLNGVSQYGEKTERDLFTNAQSGDIVWQTTGRCSCVKIQPVYVRLLMEEDFLRAPS